MPVVEQVLDDITHLRRIKDWLADNEIVSDCTGVVTNPATFESMVFINIVNEEDVTAYHLRW